MPPKPATPQITPKQIYSLLTRWSIKSRREFPWRGLTDPYRVWISEIILVQTTTAVGLDRYRRFLKRFPTLRSLSRASLDEVMKEWEGLGYYQRARNLHRAAKIITTTYRGNFPSNYDEILALPGIGEYCAAAISNLCFGRNFPPLDTNVARVGARLFGVDGDVRAGKTRRIVHERLVRLMSVGSGAVWTNGLIDLGASVCSPRSPQCGSCPFSHVCVAHLESRETTIGVTPAKAPRKVVNVACGIIRRADKRILIAQRLDSGLLPNLWEFPGGKREGNESLAVTCQREIMEELGVEVAVGERRMMIAHAYSHYSVRLHVFDCKFKSGKPKAIGCQKFRWMRASDLESLAFPVANQRIIEDLLKQDN